MAKAIKSITLAEEAILSKIHLIRGKKVMLDYDLAEMYAVETKQLKRQVRRNIDRFPADFMFELTLPEYAPLRSQFGTLKQGEHSKYAPMAFTEQGVANSKRHLTQTGTARKASNKKQRRHSDRLRCSKKIAHSTAGTPPPHRFPESG